MKKLVAMALAAGMALTMAAPAAVSAAEPAMKRAILDTDMGYLNDDAIVLFMLAQEDAVGNCDFLGVTTVGGNSWCASGATAALRQLELIGRSDIPVYMGCDVPLMGFRNLDAESKIWGMPEYAGAYWDWSTSYFCDVNERPTDYKNLPSEPKYGYAETEVQDQHAVDFIIEQVHKYPGEVTIFVIGAGTNMALAVRKDPSIVEDAAGVIYMGGAVDIPGNSSSAAEFNWYYDPEGIRVCLESPWKSQVDVPNDVAEAVFYTKEYKEKKKIRDASREIMNIKTRTCFTQLFPYYHKMGNYPCEEFREQSKDCAGKHWYGCANPFKRIYADLPDV